MPAQWIVERTQNLRFPFRIRVEQDGRQLLAVRGERDVGQTRMPPVARPLGLAVPQQHELALRVIRSGPVGQRVGGIHRPTVPTR